MAVQEQDLGQEVTGIMSAFRSRLLRYQIENDAYPPMSEYEAATWKALDDLLCLMAEVDPEVDSRLSIRNHFKLSLKCLSEDEKLVGIEISPKSVGGRRVLEVLDRLNASFT